MKHLKSIAYHDFKGKIFLGITLEISAICLHIAYTEKSVLTKIST